MEDLSQRNHKNYLNNFPLQIRQEKSLKREIQSVSSAMKKEEDNSDQSKLRQEKMGLRDKVVSFARYHLWPQ